MGKNATKTGAKDAARGVAEMYRLLQAERLIRSFCEEVEVDGKVIKVPVFVLADKKTVTYKLNPILERHGESVVS